MRLSILAPPTAAVAQLSYILIVAGVFNAALDTPAPSVRRRIPRQTEDAHPTEGKGAQPDNSAPPRAPCCQLLAHAIKSSRVHVPLLRLLTCWPPAPWPRHLAVGRRGSRPGPGSQSPAPFPRGVPRRSIGLV